MAASQNSTTVPEAADSSTHSGLVKRKCAPTIAEFFDGKSVFVTGAAGFVGSVLLETVLRCCPGTRKVYILLRAKKGVDPETRKEQIFKKMIFNHIKTSDPDLLKKVEVVQGDVTLDDLGISPAVLKKLEEDVSIVFHCAAVISFARPLRQILSQNTIGTENVVKFCRRLKNLASFVHTSTAFSFCNKKYVAESIPPLQVPATELIAKARSGDDEGLAAMLSKCLPPWPNTYTFSKAVAENYLKTEATDLPLAIVRPSVIVCAWKGISPGYLEEGGGIVDVSIGIGKGFIRVLLCKEEKVIDLIPVDVVANTLMTAAWYIGTRQTDELLVVNCSSGSLSPVTWGELISTLYGLNKMYPLPNMYQTPSLVMRRYPLTYWPSALANHYAPALCIDAVLYMMRKKPKLTKLYRFYDLALHYLRPFLTEEWTMACENYKMLMSVQNPKDKEVFPIDIRSLVVRDVAENLRTGSPLYDWGADKRKYSERLPIAHKRYILTTTIKWMTIFWFLIFVGLIISRIFVTVNRGFELF